MHIYNFVLLFFLLFGCQEETPALKPIPPTPFDPAQATMQAESYLSKLFPGVEVNGPVCLGEKVIEQFTQCSYTYSNAGALQVGTILCSMSGCREGSAPIAVPATQLPTQNATIAAQDSISNDWLLWYLLFSNGGTSYGYNTWYINTPDYGRNAGYSSGYIPSTASRGYYNSNYSSSVKTYSATKYTTKAPTTSTSTKTSSSKTTSTKPTSTKPTSTGWGKPSRSSGVRSSGSRSSGRR